MTKVDIISGFLGAGKTTLIKKLIQEELTKEKVLLIENEFGEIGIDGGFLKDAGIEIKEMNSGCICCSLVGDFKSVLKDALEKYKPDRIIIEPSGVGKLSDVIEAVANIKEYDNISLNSFATVVDSIKYKTYMDNFGEFFKNQIENASAIILSRSQKLSDEKLDICVKEIKKYNNKASIITTPWDELSGKQILSAIEGSNSLEKEVMNNENVEKHSCNCNHMEKQEHSDKVHKCHCHNHEKDNNETHGCHCHHHEHHHADEVFATWGIETPKKYKYSELDNKLRKLIQSKEYGEILRAKGIVQDVDGKWIDFDLVPEEYEIRYGNVDYTGRICVIGVNLNNNKLERLFC